MTIISKPVDLLPIFLYRIVLFWLRLMYYYFNFLQFLISFRSNDFKRIDPHRASLLCWCCYCCWWYCCSGLFFNFPLSGSRQNILWENGIDWLWLVVNKLVNNNLVLEHATQTCWHVVWFFIFIRMIDFFYILC